MWNISSWLEYLINDLEIILSIIEFLKYLFAILLNILSLSLFWDATLE